MFIIKDNQILLLKRKKEPFANHWEIPAGKVDGDESFEQAVIREAKEETNLNVRPIREIGVNINQEKQFESHIFLAEVIEGDINNNEPEKHSDIKYFPINNLPEKLGSTTQKGIRLIK